MLDHTDLIGGPHFDRELIGADGRLSRLHKGGGSPPKPTKAQLAAEKKQQEMMMSLLKQQGKMRMPEMPAIPSIPPPVDTPPPPSQSSADIEDAQQEAMRQAGRRYGLLKTVHAGNTGGYGGATPMGGMRTLLG